MQEIDLTKLESQHASAPTPVFSRQRMSSFARAAFEK